MKLLIVSSHFQPAWDWGGPVRSMWNLARGLAGLGVEVTVLATNAKQKGIVDVTPERVEVGVRILTASVPGGGKWEQANRHGISFKHWKNIATQTPRADIVHINGVWGPVPILAVATSRMFRKPCVMSTRGNLELDSLARKATKKRLALRLGARKVIESASALHYTTAKERDASPSWTGAIESFVVPNPIEMVPMADGDQARKRFGVDDQTLLLGAFGRVHKQKGLDIAVRALAKSGGRSTTKLLIVGPDEGYTGELIALVDGEGLSDLVVLTGELTGEELAGAYAAVDLLVLPSHHESFGNVVVEAAAQGTPCLVSDQVGLKGWVAENDVGLVLPLDVNVWSEALAGLKKEDIPGRWEPKRISEITRASFSIDTVARQMLVQYEKILELSGRGAR